MSSLSFFLLLLFVGPALARSRHVIHLPSDDLQPSALAWDPSSQHFLVGSRRLPLISSVSDAGIVQTLASASDPNTNSSSCVTAISIDDSRRRLIAAFSSPARISAFDLRSPIPHRPIFSSPLPDPTASIASAAIDPATGTAFLTSSDQIYTVDLGGKISVLAQVSGGQLGGAAHVNRGFLLVIDRSKNEILKVDEEEGFVRRVLVASEAVEAAEAVAVMSDGTAVVAGGAAARWLRSRDGWSDAGVFDEFKVAEEEEKVGGVAVREGRRVYVVVAVREVEGYNGKWRSRIEEVEWGREGEGEMVWAMVLVGLGLAYFMYWRLQMGKLVASVNKKRE